MSLASSGASHLLFTSAWSQVLPVASRAVSVLQLGAGASLGRYLGIDYGSH